MNQVANELAAAGHGEKGIVKERARQYLQCSTAELHRRLREVGYDTNRKRRADAGTTSASLDELKQLSALILSTIRKNGKHGYSFETAADILRAQGLISCGLSTSRLATLLWNNMLHPSQLSEQSTAVGMRTEHPNALWGIDASICRVYYLQNGQSVAMTDIEFNRNKPKNFLRISENRLIRYVVSDHTTNAIKVRFFQGSENSESLIETLIYAVQKQDGNPMHGVPFAVMMDPGAAVTSHMTHHWLERMQVRLIVNRPGNARAKGFVEKGQDIVERNFEARLVQTGFKTLEELNAKAERWAAWFGSVPIHSRLNSPRFAAWMKIKADQLRVAPDLTLMRDLARTAPLERTLDGHRKISFVVKGVSHDYDLTYVPNTYVRSKVRVCVNPYRAPAIDVESTDPATGEVTWTTVEPLVLDDFNFRVDLPIAGEEVRVAPDSIVDRNRKDILMLQYGVDTLDAVEKAKRRKERPMAHVDSFADIDQAVLPDYLAKRGTALNVTGHTVAPVNLSVVDACMRLREALGERYNRQVYAWVDAKFGVAGVPEEQIESLVAQFGGRMAPPEPGTGALRAVGGDE